MKVIVSTIGMLLLVLVNNPRILMAGQETHGGDGIVLGTEEGIELLDTVECSEITSPEKNPVVWKILREKLDFIENVYGFRNSANYLKSFLIKGKLTWCLSRLALKEIDDEGKTPLRTSDLNPSKLVLSYNKVQIAINYANGQVYLQEDQFKQLKDFDVAVLYTHEILWHAVGFSLVETGDIIRSLSTLLLSDLSQTRPDYFIQKVEAILGAEIAEKSPLMQRLRYDFSLLNDRENFKLKEIDSATGNHFIVQTLGVEEDNVLLGKEFTSLNPNPQYPQIWSDKTKLRTLYFKNTSYRELKSREKLCKDLELNIIDNKQPWRLATGRELYELFRLGLEKIRYASIKRVAYSFNQNSRVIRAQTLQDDLIFANGGAPVFLADDGELYEFSARFPKVTEQYPLIDIDPKPLILPPYGDLLEAYLQRQQQLQPEMQLPSYICVRDAAKKE